MVAQGEAGVSPATLELWLLPPSAAASVCKPDVLLVPLHIKSNGIVHCLGLSLSQ